MRAWWLMLVGVVACVGIVLLGQLAMVAFLRAVGIKLPFSLPFRFYRARV